MYFHSTEHQSSYFITKNNLAYKHKLGQRKHKNLDLKVKTFYFYSLVKTMVFT